MALGAFLGTLVFAAFLIILFAVSRSCYGPADRTLAYLWSVLTVGCMWLLWFSVYMAQVYPMILPKSTAIFLFLFFIYSVMHACAQTDDNA